VRFRLLGRLEADADGVDLTPVRPKQRALLALLLLRSGEVVAIAVSSEGPGRHNRRLCSSALAISGVMTCLRSAGT
jgi:hypothetical protein